MEFGDIIYILIGVAWLVYSFLKKGSKKPVQAKREPAYDSAGDRDVAPEPVYVAEEKPGMENKRSIFEEILFDGQNEVILQPKERKIEKKIPASPVPEPVKEIKKTSFSDMKGKTELSDRNYDNEPGDDEPSEKIDLRDAVIYSEILNRPKF